MKTLYVSDLDGTLLNSRAAVSPRTAEIVNGLVRRGVMFAYATARSFESASAVTAGLELRLPVIVHNGAFIVEPAGGEPVAEPCYLDSRLKAFAFEAFENAGVEPLVYSYDGGRHRVKWLRGHENDGLLSYINARAGDLRLTPCGSRGELFDGRVFYFSAIDRPGRFEALREKFMRHGGFFANCQIDTYNGFEWLEIMSIEATKGQGVLKLMKLLGADRAVCFGDNLNDLTMFEVCGECYAVSNAHERVRAAATGVIGAADEDGVAQWLLEHAG